MWKNSSKDLDGQRLHFFLYGPSRSGKTHICATAPEPVFIFPRNENSKETIRGLDLPYREIASMAEMDAVLDELLAAQRSGKIRQYGQTICIESMSHYSEIVELNLPRNAKGGLDWGAYTRHFVRMRDILWQLDMHVIMTALDMVKRNSKGDVVEAGVRIFGQASKTLPGSCDAVGYTEQLPTLPPKWQVHFHKYGLFDAGTRIRGMQHATFENFQWGTHVAPLLNGQATPDSVQQQNEGA